MSSDAFKAFMAKVSADQGLREKLRAAGGDAGISTQALVDFANGQGYVFSAADVTGELSDAELGAASGRTGLHVRNDARPDGQVDANAQLRAHGQRVSDQAHLTGRRIRLSQLAMNPPPRFAGTADRDTIRAAFDGAGYTEAGLGPGVATLLALGVHAGLARQTDGRAAQGLLARLFLFGLTATWDEVCGLLGRDHAEAFRRAGLLTGDAECVAAVSITPVGGRLIAHDRRDAHRTGAAAFVPGPAPASRRFADIAIRRPGAAVLDLGCGQGLLAVLAAESGGTVTATDLNPRAIAFAAFNAALNGLDNITCVEGDLFAPVSGERFDLILANPPFVISPASAFLYRDGHGICERIAQEAPPRLTDGGILEMTCNWPCRRGRDWREDLSAWFRDSGCDVWVLQTDHLDVAAYAGIWLRQAHPEPADVEPELDRWLAFYEKAGIEAVGGGVAAMRRRAIGGLVARPWIEIRDMPPANGPCGDTIARVLEARETLARFEGPALLDATVALVPEARAIVTQRASASGWERESSELRLTRGLAMALRLDPAGAAIAGFLDGSRSARAAATAFAETVGVPAEALLPELPALLRRLIEMGLAVVPRSSEPDLPGK